MATARARQILSRRVYPQGGDVQQIQRSGRCFNGSGRVPIRLFHPRSDRWSDHFQIVGDRIEPPTPLWEATVWRSADSRGQSEIASRVGSSHDTAKASRTSMLNWKRGICSVDRPGIGPRMGAGHARIPATGNGGCLAPGSVPAEGFPPDAPPADSPRTVLRRFLRVARRGEYQPARARALAAGMDSRASSLRIQAEGPKPGALFGR